MGDRAPDERIVLDGARQGRAATSSRRRETEILRQRDEAAILGRRRRQAGVELLQRLRVPRLSPEKSLLGVLRPAVGDRQRAREQAERDGAQAGRRPGGARFRSHGRPS